MQNKKNVSIRALPELAKPPPHPPIRATLPTLSAVATIGETFSLSKKRAQKNSGKGKPPPNSGIARIETFFYLHSSLRVNVVVLDAAEEKNSDFKKYSKYEDEIYKNILFVCLFVSLFVCLFVCLLV